MAAYALQPQPELSRFVRLQKPTLTLKVKVFVLEMHRPFRSSPSVLNISMPWALLFYPAEPLLLGTCLDDRPL